MRKILGDQFPQYQPSNRYILYTYNMHRMEREFFSFFEKKNLNISRYSKHFLKWNICSDGSFYRFTSAILCNNFACKFLPLGELSRPEKLYHSTIWIHFAWVWWVVYAWWLTPELTQFRKVSLIFLNILKKDLKAAKYIYFLDPFSGFFLSGHIFGYLCKEKK